jgi:hypothetical protein
LDFAERLGLAKALDTLHATYNEAVRLNAKAAANDIGPVRSVSTPGGTATLVDDTSSGAPEGGDDDSDRSPKDFLSPRRPKSLYSNTSSADLRGRNNSTTSKFSNDTVHTGSVGKSIDTIHIRVCRQE